jgi:hypothetical protein
LNSKKILTERTSAVFLAIILIAGTIVVSSSTSFMITETVHAQPYYGMDKKYSSYESDYGMDNNYQKTYGKDNRDKSKDSVNLKKIKCNNININVNGIELNVTSFPFLSSIAADDAEASEGKFGTASYGSGSGSYGGHSGSDKDGFAFICINNNNNVVSGGNQTIPEPEPTPPIPPSPTEDFLDLAVANRFYGDVSILLGDGDGNFTQAADSPITVETNPFSIAVDNFD